MVVAWVVGIPVASSEGNRLEQAGGQEAAGKVPILFGATATSTLEAIMYDYRLVEFFLDLPKIAGIKWHAQSSPVLPRWPTE